MSALTTTRRWEGPPAHTVMDALEVLCDACEAGAPENAAVFFAPQRTLVIWVEGGDAPCG